jgi:hypothetical protein
MLWVDLVAERGRGLAALSDSLPGVGEQSVEQVRGEHVDIEKQPRVPLPVDCVKPAPAVATAAQLGSLS